MVSMNVLSRRGTSPLLCCLPSVSEGKMVVFLDYHSHQNIGDFVGFRPISTAYSLSIFAACIERGVGGIRVSIVNICLFRL